MPLGKALKTTTLAFGLAMTAASVTALSVQSVAAQEAADYSGEQLDAFTVAYLQVIDLREQYAPVLEAAETEEQQQEIIDEANVEILDAIENTDGMSVEEYEAIAQDAAEDQDLSERIMARVEEMASAVE